MVVVRKTRVGNIQVMSDVDHGIRSSSELQALQTLALDFRSLAISLRSLFNMQVYYMRFRHACSSDMTTSMITTKVTGSFGGPTDQFSSRAASVSVDDTLRML